MNINEETITRFYKAFRVLDAQAMADCYVKDPVFNDQVFGIIEGDAVFSMWSMLCSRAKDFNLEFDNVESDGEYGTCNWKASYTYGPTGRKVVNSVKAHMRFEDGKISEHTDEYNLYAWSRQAYGLTGVLLGWSSFLKNKIRSGAHQKLREYMKTHPHNGG